MVPVCAFGDDLGVPDAGFLMEFTQRGAGRILAFVDAALRHLPPVAGTFGVVLRLDAAADPDPALAVQHEEADARAVGGGFGF